MKFWCDRCEELKNELGVIGYHNQYCIKCWNYINTHKDDYNKDGELSATDQLLAEYDLKGVVK
jgi:hypothetical protein